MSWHHRRTRDKGRGDQHVAVCGRKEISHAVDDGVRHWPGDDQKFHLRDVVSCGSREQSVQDRHIRSSRLDHLHLYRHYRRYTSPLQASLGKLGRARRMRRDELYGCAILYLDSLNHRHRPITGYLAWNNGYGHTHEVAQKIVGCRAVIIRICVSSWTFELVSMFHMFAAH